MHYLEEEHFKEREHRLLSPEAGVCLAFWKNNKGQCGWKEKKEELWEGE